MRSLYSTFVFFTLLVMVISGILSFFLVNAYYQNVFKQQNDEKYTNVALEIQSYVLNEKELDLHLYLRHIAKTGYQFIVFDEEKRPTYLGDPFRDEHIDDQVINKVLAGKIYNGMAQFPKKTFVTGFFANEASNSIGVPLSYKGETYALFLRPNIVFHFNEVRYLFAWLLGLIVFFSLIFEIILAKYLIQPLSKLNEATKKIRAGTFPLSFSINRKDEIGELAESFRSMSTQLAQLDEMRNEFIANITHDIQSPLGNIKGYTELLQSDHVSKEKKGEYITIINEETNRLSTLSSQLLLLSTLDQLSNLQMKKTHFSLSDQIQSVITTYKWQLFEKEITLHHTLQKTMYEGEPSYLLRVWDNIINNAIKYNKQGGSITIALREEKDAHVITCTDSGIGMTPTQVKNVFTRFYRADESRTNSKANKGGTGLGLAIANKIVTLHGGTIHIQSEINIGTTVVVTLPKKL